MICIKIKLGLFFLKKIFSFPPFEVWKKKKKRVFKVNKIRRIFVKHACLYKSYLMINVLFCVVSGLFLPLFLKRPETDLFRITKLGHTTPPYVLLSPNGWK